MKNNTLLKLLSVLLLLTLLLVGCAKKDNPDAESTPPLNDEQKHEAVEPILENFFKLSAEKRWNKLGAATRFDGAFVGSMGDATSKNLIALRTADVDTKNVVTEVIKVYNTQLKKEVLSITNTYKNGAYAPFNWNDLAVYDETVKYPDSVVDVSIEVLTDDYHSIEIIKVSKATVTEIDSENPDACIYDIAVTYEFYDVAGNLILKTNNDSIALDTATSAYSAPAYYFGSTHVVFDEKTGTIVRIVNGETEPVITTFDYETEKYGYFFDMDNASGAYFLEVYDKNTFQCILDHHYFKKISYYPDVFFLEDGDVLVQYVEALSEESNLTPDYTDSMGFQYRVTWELLDVELGKTETIELDFVIDTLYSNYELNEMEIPGFDATEHVVNYAVVSPIENGKLSNPVVKVLDNDLSVLLDMTSLVPEHLLDFFAMQFEENLLGFTVLESGDYLVDLHDIVTPKAIVSKDGVLRAYLPADAELVGSYVVTSKGVYDYDMKALYSFEENNLQWEFILGNKIIVSSIPTDVLSAIDGTKNYLSLTYDTVNFSLNPIFSGAEITERTNDYVIVFDGKYTLYNAELSHVLTTANEMTVYEFDGSYLVYTHLEEHDLFYSIASVA